MLQLELLEALDCIQWLGSGDEVSRRYPISQPTLSRSCAKALDRMGLAMVKRDGEWDISGDTQLLLMEREVPQVARRLGRRPLRLEATYWSAATYCSPLPERWILGRSNIVGIPRNFQLVSERVVDACLAGLPDGPTEQHPDLTAIPLMRMPVFFCCAPQHPLLDRAALTIADIAEFPSLGLPEGAYPQVEQTLKMLGLWNNPVRMRRYRRDRWEGKTEEQLVVGYGTPLSMRVSGGSICRLPLALPFDSGDALVVRKDVVDDPCIQELVQLLQANLRRCLADGLAEVEILD